MEILLKNIQLTKNYLIAFRTFEIGSLKEIVKYAFEGKDPSWKTQLPALLSLLVEGVRVDSNKQRDLLATKITQYCFMILETLIFNLFTKQKKEEKRLINASMQDSSQYSIASSKFQYSDGSQATLMYPQSANTQFVEQFQKFFSELSTCSDFFSNCEKLFSSNRPVSELKVALSSLVKTLLYIDEKDQLQQAQLTENLSVLKRLSTLVSSNQAQGSNDEIQLVNSILFGNKLDKIVRLLNFNNQLGTQQEIHFAIARIYFTAHSRSRSNFNRKYLKQLQYQGKDMLYNLIRHYVFTQEPDRQNKQICSKEDTAKLPIPGFIFNYLQLLFMPIYNQFQELFDKHVMSRDKRDVDFYFSILSPTINYIIPFLQNLPPEFCNFFAMFNQIINETENSSNSNGNFHNLRGPQAPSLSKQANLFPVKQLFVNRFLLNPNLRSICLPIAKEQEYEYIEALNLFSKLFYNTPKDDKVNSLNQNFLKLNVAIQKNFQNIVSNYHVQSGSMDVYNIYIVKRIVESDYNLIHSALKVTQFSDLEQSEYPLLKFKEQFPQKKWVEQKLQMDIIREIATPANDDNIPIKRGDVLTPVHQEAVPAFTQQQQSQQLLSQSQQQQQQQTPVSLQQQFDQQQLYLLAIQQQQQIQLLLQLQQQPQQFSGLNPNISSPLIPQFQGILNRGNPNQQSLLSQYPGNTFSSKFPLSAPQTSVGGGGVNFNKSYQNQNNNNATIAPEQFQQGNYGNPFRKNDDDPTANMEQFKTVSSAATANNTKIQATLQQQQQQQELSNINNMETLNLGKVQQAEEKWASDYSKHIANQLEQNVFEEKKKVLIEEERQYMRETLVNLEQKNEYLKLIMKTRYPQNQQYIDDLDNPQSLEEMKKKLEAEEEKDKWRESRKRRHEDDDEFYQLQRVITQAFKEVEEIDIQLELHQKIHQAIF